MAKKKDYSDEGGRWGRRFGKHMKEWGGEFGESMERLGKRMEDEFAPEAAEAGKRMGLTAALVLSGKTDQEDIDKWEFKPDRIFKDLLDAVNFILKGERS